MNAAPSSTPDFSNYSPSSTNQRKRVSTGFKICCWITALVSVVILATLIGSIVAQGWEHVTWKFVTSAPTGDATTSGIGPALMGTIWVCIICASFAMPLGLLTAIYLVEFKPTNRWFGYFHEFVQLNISNLAGVPSIVYGLVGLSLFATMFGLFGNENDPSFEMGAKHYRQYITEGSKVIFIPTSDRQTIPELKTGMTAADGSGNQVTLNIIGPDDDFPEDDEALAVSLLSDDHGGVLTRHKWYYFRLPIGRSVLAAGLTLMLVILPIIIISSQEALKAVPSSLREAALGLGATQWQVVKKVTLPAAIPGIMTGAILSTSRAIGEAAPIVILAGLVYIKQNPSHLMDHYSVLPLQIFYWAGQPDVEHHHIAAAGSIVLLAILLGFNAVAISIRQTMQKPLS